MSNLQAWTLLCLALAPSSAFAQTASSPTFVSTMAARPALRLLTEDELPVFEDSFKSTSGLVKAANKTLAYLAKEKPAGRYLRLGERDYGYAVLEDSIRALLEILKSSGSPAGLNERIRKEFDVYQSNGLDGTGRVVFSSYYQPVLTASLKKTEKYRFPLSRKPADMVEADLGLFDKKYNGETLTARVDKKTNRLVPYFSREEIDIRKALAGKGHEVAWLKDRFDVLDLHIQGSGILKLTSGKEVLARYAATNARPYNSVGLTLVKTGVMTRDEITHD